MKNKDTIYTSHLGVYAIITKDSSILLIKKNRGQYKGLLDLPGGSLEEYESIGEALKREIKEETGSNILQYRQLHTFSSFFEYFENSKSHMLRHIAIIYQVEINNNEVKYVPDGEDSDGCVWVNIDNIKNDIISPIVQKALTLL